ncbi:ATP-dependent DNA helicase Snf21 [Marasmius tenuissimus]|uniref:ATP-dependent DNA helicase Snf21 n=1 Tax=Marasmius tenuissimus TaxID=585030 RepID=A0ABR2Z840_9AGAR
MADTLRQLQQIESPTIPRGGQFSRNGEVSGQGAPVSEDSVKFPISISSERKHTLSPLDATFAYSPKPLPAMQPSIYEADNTRYIVYPHHHQQQHQQHQQKKGKGKNTVEEPPTFVGGKRKRGLRPMPVEPSVTDDVEDGGRDQVRIFYVASDISKPKVKIQKRWKSKAREVVPAVREEMKKAFNECYQAVLACEAEDGRKRCELFREVPDRRDYPDYYTLIPQPIALSQLRKRAQSNFHKDVNQHRADWQLMFDNARIYNQEGSWVYNDAEEMEKVFNAAWDCAIVGSGLPRAPLGGRHGDASPDTIPQPVPHPAHASFHPYLPQRVSHDRSRDASNEKHYPSTRLHPAHVNHYSASGSQPKHEPVFNPLPPRPEQEQQTAYQSYASADPQISLIPPVASYRSSRMVQEQQPHQHVRQYLSSSGGDPYTQQRQNSIMSDSSQQYTPISPQRTNAEDQGIHEYSMQAYEQPSNYAWFCDENYIQYQNQHGWHSNAT